MWHVAAMAFRFLWGLEGAMVLFEALLMEEMSLGGKEVQRILMVVGCLYYFQHITWNTLPHMENVNH